MWWCKRNQKRGWFYTRLSQTHDKMLHPVGQEHRRIFHLVFVKTPATENRCQTWSWLPFQRFSLAALERERGCLLSLCLSFNEDGLAKCPCQRVHVPHCSREKLNNSAFSLYSMLHPREEQSDASSLTRFGSSRVMLHGQAAVCQLNELAPCWRTIPVLSHCPSWQLLCHNALLSTDAFPTLRWASWDTLCG